MRASTRDLAHDALELAELQFRLFAADGQQCVHQSMAPLLVVLVGLVLALSGFPLALLGVMYALVEYAQLAHWSAALCSAALGMTAGGLVAVAGLAWLRPRLAVLIRSFHDLKTNLEWLKSALRRHSSDMKEDA